MMNSGKVLEPVRESTAPSTAVGATVVVGVLGVLGVLGVPWAPCASVCWVMVVSVADAVGAGERVLGGATVVVVGEDTQTTTNPNAINAPHASFRR